jgi:hypothetical protein
MPSFQEPIPFPVEAVFSFYPRPDSEAINRARVVPTVPRTFLYTFEMAGADFGIGSEPATIQMDVTQVSATGVESDVATVIG